MTPGTTYDVGSLLFDEEDAARISLIWELRQGLGVNDEAIPIILNLLNQLYLQENGRIKF